MLRPALVALALLVFPAAAQAAPLTTPCGGRAIAPDKVITGEFGTDLSKSYVMVPFDVPRGTTAIRVKYCWDRPESGSSRHTLDLGLYEPLKWGDRVWGPREFRGWGGSSHPDVTLSAEGFSSEADYVAQPRIEPPGKTTRAFLPGAIRSGRWAAELGVAAVIPQSEGDADGKVGWRVEIEFADDPAFADEPYKPARYDPRPVRRKPGWYSGDFHVHAEHSAYGNATMTSTFDYAFSPVAQGGGGLDFLTLSDYVSGSAWGEIGRYQPRYPKNLIIPSAEVITYRGHTNNHGSQHFVDYREGPIYELQADGSVKQIRGTRDPREIFSEVHRFGGWTQVNHPTIFPPVSPAAAALCRGCFWEYSDAETDWSKVDAFEVATGPADIVGTQNPFTVTAIARYDELTGQGYKIAAVGSSDSHEAGKADGPLDAPGRRGAHRRLRRRPVGAGHPLRRAGSPHLREGGGRRRRRHPARRAALGPLVVEAGDHRRHDPRQGRQLHSARDRRQRAPAPDRQGRRDRRDRAGDERRLHLPLRGPGPRPLAPPGHARQPDRHGLEPDLGRAGLGRRGAPALPVGPAVGRTRPQAGAPASGYAPGVPAAGRVRPPAAPRRAWWPSPTARRRRRRSAAASGRRSSGRAAWARRRGAPAGRRARPTRS